jgi:O-antigen ligase
MVKLLLLMLVIVNEVRQPAQFRTAIVAIIVGVCLQAAIALLQYTLGHQLGLHVLGEATDADIKALAEATFTSGDLKYRPDGIMGHSNLLACYLALYLPVAIALLLTPVSRTLKALAVTALVLGQPALVLTLSRTGWIDFLVALVLVLCLGAVHPVSRRRFVGTRLAIVAVTVVVGVAMSPAIIYRILASDPNAVEMRLEWIQVARAMIIDHPVLGVGLNTYVFAQVPYGKDKSPEEMTDRYGDTWPAVHNSYLLTWTEQGTLGFAFWIAMHIAVLTVAVKNLRIRDPVMHAIGVGLLAGFVAVMVDGLTSFFVRCEAPARMFWIAVGLILALGYWRREQEEERAVEDALAPVPESPQAAPQGRWLPVGKSAWR